jgi:nitrate reductase gamma subunit
MRRALLWSAGPLCVLVAFGVAWLFELSTEHVLALAPVIVVGTAAVVGLVLLWVKAARDSLGRGRDASGDVDGGSD